MVQASSRLEYLNECNKTIISDIVERFKTFDVTNDEARDMMYGLGTALLTVSQQLAPRQPDERFSGWRLVK